MATSLSPTGAEGPRDPTHSSLSLAAKGRPADPPYGRAPSQSLDPEVTTSMSSPDRDPTLGTWGRTDADTHTPPPPVTSVARSRAPVKPVARGGGPRAHGETGSEGVHP